MTLADLWFLVPVAFLGGMAGGIFALILKAYLKGEDL